MAVTRDMTKGSPLKIILTFAVPILLGSLLQQTYNLVDSMVVGRYIGTDAFGATSAAGTLMFLFVSVLIGVGSGAGIIISQLYTQKEYERLHTAFSTTIIALTALTVIISTVCIIFTKDLLTLMRVDKLILDDATTYLRIIMLGLLPMMFFNMYSGFLRGVGNSKAPMIFLGVATVVNIILDLVFVVAFKMGVEGVAIATVIANLTAGVCTFIYTNKKISFFRIRHRSDLKFNFPLLKKVFMAGLPVILQSFLVSASLVLLQGIFNSFGKDYTSGYGLSSKIDQLITLPLNAISNSVSTFIAQNKGQQENERIKKAFWQSAISMSVITWIFGLLAVLCLDNLISLFIIMESGQSSEIVIKVASEFVIMLVPFYPVMGIMFMSSSALASASDLKAPIIIMILSMVIRTALAFILLPYMSYYSGIVAFPISWIIGAVLGAIRFISGKWKTKSYLKPQEE